MQTTCWRCNPGLEKPGSLMSLCLQHHLSRDAADRKRAGLPWLEDERHCAEIMFSNGMDESQVALELDRTVWDVLLEFYP